MPKPKFVKPLLIGVACTIPVGLVVGLSVNWDHTQFISAVGSSGVKPFIESFGKAYHNSHNKFDVTVESGGTMFAVEQVAKGFTNIGNASNNPYLVVNTQGYKDKWTDKKTFTLGWEGLVMMYSLPKGLSKDFPKEKFNIVISEENILPLYGVFSGYHQLKVGNWDPIMDSLWYYAPADVKALITNEKDVKLLKETQILPFVRAGGNNGANSSIAFSYYSNLKNFEDMTPDQQQAFKYGKYGSDGLEIMQTDESNARAWQSFVYNDDGASMTYLTSSFITNENNRKQMEEKGYKLAGYQPKGTTTPVFVDGTKESLKMIDSQNGYNWYRPINIMIDLNVQKTKDFIYWIYMHTDEDMPISSFTSLSEEYSDTILSKGAKPLSVNEAASMLSQDIDWTSTTTLKQMLFDSTASDFTLEETRQGVFKTVYGAKDLWPE